MSAHERNEWLYGTLAFLIFMIPGCYVVAWNSGDIILDDDTETSTGLIVIEKNDQQETTQADKKKGAKKAAPNVLK